MNSPVCSHCLCFQCEGFVSNMGRHDSRVFLCLKCRVGRKSTRFWKLHCLTKIALQIQTPYPKLMIMVSFCWKMNVLPNKIKKQFCFIDDDYEINNQSCCIFSGPPCIYLLFECVQMGDARGPVHSHYFFGIVFPKCPHGQSAHE